MIFTLLIAYQAKHFICDYLLQGQYMLGKFKAFPDYIAPLLAHSAVHSIATFLIVLTINPKLALNMALLDGGIHFVVDRIKASPSLLGRHKAIAANECLAIKQMSEGTMPIPVTKEESDKKQAWAIERLKSNKLFWWSLGLDQKAHHLTHYLIIYFLVRG